ncbi:general stress protein [Candidatus Moduliflexus flocculans]|uniref:General stress protein n=1 Tax=Candidatus Moduliflexus flocculans TaxID=1499966 RepID=A0A0S6VTW7_9BACT|nr:general stress protein [Candidatus Moduliflexus flocculans]
MKQPILPTTMADWDAAAQQIPPQGLLLLKFSPRCPISRGVERDVDEWFGSLSDERAPRYVKVDVVNAREVSQQLAQALGVAHQSPQAIWLNTERAIVWNASHHSITTAALNKLLSA